MFNFVYVIIALTAAFSYGVGNDTYGYRMVLHESPILSNISLKDFTQSRHQPLFVFICSLCRTIYDDLLVLQLVQIFLIYHSLYLVLKKLDLCKFWVLFLFFGYCYLALLSGRRECFGLAFCLYAMLFYLENKWAKYYILVLIGFLFHSGMVIFAVFPLMKLLGNNNFLGIVIIFVCVYIIQFVFQYVQLFEEFVNENDSIVRYSLEEGQQLQSTTILLITIELLIFIWYAVRDDNGRQYGYGDKSLVYLGLLHVALGFLSSALPIIYRYRAHFAVFAYFALNQCFCNAKNRIVVAAIFLVFSYTPVATFIYGCKNHPLAFYYCSYFSSQYAKEEMDALTKMVHWND